MTPSEALAVVLADVRAAENKAIDRNKPTMWAYYRTVEAQLMGAPAGADRAVVEWAMRCVHKAEDAGEAVASDPSDDGWRAWHIWWVVVGQTWALSVYAERILRLSGHRLPKRSLAWLRAQKRWPDVPAAGVTA